MKRLSFICLLSLSLFTFGSALFLHGNLTDQSEFYQIDPVQYYFHYGSYYSRIHHTTSAVRMWTTFLKADTDAHQKPLFVFFNGGPGSGTTCGLLGFYTARKTLDNTIFGGGDKYINNPFSWTRLGNLLYIDARCTGFSYGLLAEAQPRNFENLVMEFTGRNFNSYIDAADYLRVLLKFLQNRPSIQKNPIIIVGESYGGVRTTLMLHMLLNYRRYGDGTEVFQDPGLVNLIQEHYNTVFPQYTDQEVPPEVIISQFGNQVLIQPAIDQYQSQEEINLLEQPGSIVYQVAEEVGRTFIPCTDSNCSRLGTIYDFIEDIAGRDLYGCHKPKGWTSSFFDKGALLMAQSEHFYDMTNRDARNILQMYAANREQGYKYLFDRSQVVNTDPDLSAYSMDLSVLPDKERYLYKSKMKQFMSGLDMAADSDFNTIFGQLRPWDLYYLALNYDANYAFHYFTASVIRNYPSYSYNYLTGRKFLQNLIHVKTFITNAKWDVVVYTNALPVGLNHHTDIVEQSTHLKSNPLQVERPGMIEVRYREGAFGINDIGIRTIRFPLYSRSSHPVSLTEPMEFYQDVATWLQE